MTLKIKSLKGWKKVIFHRLPLRASAKLSALVNRLRVFKQILILVLILRYNLANEAMMKSSECQCWALRSRSHRKLLTPPHRIARSTCLNWLQVTVSCNTQGMIRIPQWHSRVCLIFNSSTSMTTISETSQSFKSNMKNLHFLVKWEQDLKKD